VLEALSWGVPVIGTALALRGIRGEAGSGVLFGETADDLLDQALIVGRDPIRRADLERAGWERTRLWHSHEGTSEKLRAFLEAVTG
jgi:glycosyltransferase involved in cell wall biosynthesis